MNTEIMKVWNWEMGPKHERSLWKLQILQNLKLKLIRQAKLGHYREYVETDKDKPNKIAKLFDELSGKNRDNSIHSLTYNDKTPANDMDIAEALNSHFTNITNKYLPDNQQKPTPGLSCIQEFVGARVPPNNFFKILLITEQEVQNFLTKLDIAKATGWDNIEAKFLKLIGPFITKALMEIWVLSYEYKIDNKLWQLADLSRILNCNRSNHQFKYLAYSMLPCVIPALPFANMLPYVIPALPFRKYVPLCHTGLHCLR